MKQGRLACRMPGVHLNDTGRSQAQAVAKALAQFKAQASAGPSHDRPVKKRKDRPEKQPEDKEAKKPEEKPVWKLYSSPMERAVETAEPIAQALGLEIVIRPGLIETNCGDWAGMTVKSLSRRKLWKVIQNTPSQFRFPGGESFIETQQRIVEEIEFLRTQGQPRDIAICVSHADPIKLLVSHYLGLPFDNFQRLVIDAVSITVLHLGESSARLMVLNITPSFYLARQ